mmetsp:Transcript_21955/g.18829  ORF Transcript_21955/g.18829 Transcript_21955/m.18829 type:complete len:134 (+) Transcript_21955:403-804(+)
MSLSEFAKQLESIENDRTKLNKMKDDLQQEVTRLTNENNQLIQRMIIDKESMMEQWNEINKLNEMAEKKRKELEEEKKRFDESKRKFIENNKNRMSTSGGKMSEFNDPGTVDLKVYYTGQKNSSTEMNPVNKT